MKQITRTVSTFTINASAVKFVNGKIDTEDLKPIVLNDETSCDEAKALKEVVKANGKDKQYVIKSIERTDVVYGVPFDVFMKHATVIERPASQQKKEETDPAETATTESK